MKWGKPFQCIYENLNFDCNVYIISLLSKLIEKRKFKEDYTIKFIAGKVILRHILCFTVGRVLLGTRITFVYNSRIEKRITFMSNRLSWILIHSSEHLN